MYWDSINVHFDAGLPGFVEAYAIDSLQDVNAIRRNTHLKY